jgi:hypothetical protein
MVDNESKQPIAKAHISMKVLDTAIGADKCFLDDLLCFGWMEEHAERD